MRNEENTLWQVQPARRANFVKTKNALLLLLATVFLAGCMHNYDLTLINGMKITRVSKPKYDKKNGVYTYTDITGAKKTISALRVVEIAPHSDKQSNAVTPP
jgi:hypothetical protein